jgi:Tol biopolymer transport system component
MKAGPQLLCVLLMLPLSAGCAKAPAGSAAARPEQRGRAPGAIVSEVAWGVGEGELLAVVIVGANGGKARSELWSLDSGAATATRLFGIEGKIQGVSPGCENGVLALCLNDVPDTPQVGGRLGIYERGRWRFAAIPPVNAFPSCAPSGLQVAFPHIPELSPEGGPPAGATQRSWPAGIWTMGLSSAALTQVAGGREGVLEADGPITVWSPDSKQLAFTRTRATSVGGRAGVSSDLWLASADGAHVQQLTSFGDVRYPLRWRLTGDKIVFTRSAPPTRGYVRGPISLWQVGADGRAPEQLVSSDELPGEAESMWLDISPDCRMVAGVSRRAGTAGSAQGRDLQILDVGDKRVRTVATGDVRGPVWSPDGTALAFIRDQREVWVVSPAPGAKPQRVWAVAGRR